MSDALVIRGVSKAYGDVHAVRSLDLSVAAGTVYGLLGPNGAGKSTTIRMIMDIIKPDTGEILLLGESDPDRRRDRIGYLPEERGLYRKMKVRELLVYFGRLHGMEPRRARERTLHWLERMELATWAEAKVEALSKGMQQKVQIIATILHEPEAVILDEPFSGLDPTNVDLVKDVLLELRNRGVMLLLSTHQMEMAEKLCDSICLIHRGRKLLDGPIGKVKADRGVQAIQLEFEGRASFHRDPALVARVNDSGRFLELFPATGVSPHQILEAAVREVKVSRFEVMEPSLHQIFVDTVRMDGEEA
jgi:ABC-2 type transport system ATP-binding protein